MSGFRAGKKTRSKRNVGISNHGGIFLAVGLVLGELAILAVAMAVAVGFAQELDLVNVEEAPVLLFAGLLVVPRLDPLPAFQEDTASFLQEFSGNFSSPAEALNVEPFGVFLKLAAVVLPALRAGHRKGCDRSASRGVLHFWVFSQVSDQQKFLHGVVVLLCCEMARGGTEVPPLVREFVELRRVRLVRALCGESHGIAHLWLHEPLASPRLGVAKARVSEVALATFLGGPLLRLSAKVGEPKPGGHALACARGEAH